LVFTGTYEHAIDAKQRLAIPADIRAQIGGGRDHAEPVHLYVTLGDAGALCLWTEQGFEQRAAELDHSERDVEEILPYESVFFSLARRVELDRQGRIRLPENLLQRAGLDKDVVLIGVKDHMEIRDRQGWYEFVEQALRDRPGLRNPRLAMRRPGSEK
jgi:MraZ protein